MEDNIFKFITKMDNSDFELKSYIKFSDSKTFVKNITKNNHLENRRAILKTFEGYTIFRQYVFEVKGFARKFNLNYIMDSTILSGIEEPTIYFNFFPFNNENNTYFKDFPLSLFCSSKENGSTAQSYSLEVVKNNEIVIEDDNRYKTKLYNLDDEEEQKVEESWDKNIKTAKTHFRLFNKSELCSFNKFKYPAFLKYATENILSMEDE